MRTFAKLTGLTRPEEVELVPDGGGVGFIVECPGVPGNLTVAEARSLAESVRQGAEIWAVTQSPTATTIHRLFDDLGVDRIQVFGTVPEGLEFLEAHHVVPSIPIDPVGTPPKIPPPEVHPILHLDAAGEPLSTGSVGRANWESCRALIDAQPGRKMVLSGGLGPSEVEPALSEVRPWGLDLTLPANPSRPAERAEQLRRFIEAIEAAEQRLGNL